MQLELFSASCDDTAPDALQNIAGVEYEEADSHTDTHNMQSYRIVVGSELWLISSR